MKKQVVFIGGPDNGTTRILDVNIPRFRVLTEDKDFGANVVFFPKTALGDPRRHWAKEHTYIVRQVGNDAWAAVHESVA